MLGKQIDVLLWLMVSGVMGTVFAPSPYFAAFHLSSYTNTQIQTYSIPNTIMKNLSTLAIVLSGYDFPSIAVLQFKTQISYDDTLNAFNLVVTAINGTRYSFINYFILAVSESGKSYFATAEACIVPTNPSALRSTVQVANQFYKTNNNSFLAIPMLKSIQSLSLIQITSFNATPVTITNNTNIITVGIYNDNSTVNIIEICFTVILYHQTAAQNDSFLTYSYSSLPLILNSNDISANLNAAGSNTFGISFQYGPILEPKCFIGLQAFRLNNKIRQTINFDISQGGVTQVYVSNDYYIAYSYFCVAEITCVGEGMQYYPAINDCEPVCNISMCQLCSSSTSCSVCKGGNFINPLLRCSPCPANCLTCSSASSCSVCSQGFYLNSSLGCLVCPIYCTSCTGQQCIACQSGFLASGNQCLSCSGIMLNCLTCTAPSACSLCLTTYYFNSNSKGCVLCNDTMPNCYTCDLPNNCLTCYPGFYLASFSKCSACNPRIAVCCSQYIKNCTLCQDNQTCVTCAPTYFLTVGNSSCSPCTIYDPNCNVCTNKQCINCIIGYFLAANACISCTTITANCKTCANASLCLSCSASLLLVQNQCLDCPFWPLNGLFYLNDQNICESCRQATPHCRKCNSSSICTACASLFYLDQNSCKSCQEAIDHCLTCFGPYVCFICDNGFYLSSDSASCLSCGTTIPYCGQCNYLRTEAILSCQTCMPEYFFNGSSCSSCLSAIPFCLQCKSRLSCLVCQHDYYINSSHFCVNCSTILEGCKVCLSSNQCSVCLSGFLLVGGLCTPCSALVSNCWQCSAVNSSTICNACLDSYYLDPFLNCPSCSSAFRNCQSCTISKCIQCISGFYVSENGSCALCGQAIPNCIYCSREIQCLICSNNYWLDSQHNSCDSCFELSRGCSTCQKLAASGSVNCTACQDGFSLFGSTNLIFTCIECNLTMINCLACTTASICSLCANTTFLNEYSTCSRCSRYIPNCRTCSNASQCEQCQGNFILLSNGSCYSCDLSQFGLFSNSPLCSQCAFTTVPLCLACKNGYYPNAQQTQCLPCSSAVVNCAACIDSSTCVACERGFELSNSNGNCVSCLVPNCASCSNDICQECMPGNYLATNGMRCQSCNQLFGGCNSCTSSSCLACSDGYYLLGGSCNVCSSAIPNCLLCSDNQTCLLKQSPSLPTQQSPLMKPFAITVLILSVIILLGLLLWWKVTGRPSRYLLQQEMRLDSERKRMNQNEGHANQVAVEKGKLCQNCSTSPTEVILLELLCSKCDQIQRSGHQHKIRKEVQQNKKKAKDLELPPIEEQQEMSLELQSKIGDHKHSSSFKKHQIPGSEHGTSKRAPTATTNDLESQALRNLF